MAVISKKGGTGIHCQENSTTILEGSFGIKEYKGEKKLNERIKHSYIRNQESNEYCRRDREHDTNRHMLLTREKQALERNMGASW